MSENKEYVTVKQCLSFMKLNESVAKTYYSLLSVSINWVLRFEAFRSQLVKSEWYKG